MSTDQPTYVVPTKPTLASKVNWLAILTAIIGIIGIIQQMAPAIPLLGIPPVALAWATLISAILTFIVRTFFTNQPLGGDRTATLVREPGRRTLRRTS